MSHPEHLPLSFTQAREFLVGGDSRAAENLRNVASFFRLRAKESSVDAEKRLESLAYLVIAKLRLYSLETPEVRTYFLEFRSCLREVLQQRLRGSGSTPQTSLLARILRTIDARLGVLYDRTRRAQVRYFLAAVEVHVCALTRAYQAVGMSDRASDLFVLRMDLKRHAAFMSGQWLTFWALQIFKLISGYGTSLGRLVATCTLSLIFFAWIYWLADWLAAPDQRMIKDLSDVSNYLFNSLVTITGLGIDASPVTWPQRLAMGVNAVYGMVVVGLLFNVISTKLSIND